MMPDEGSGVVVQAGIDEWVEGQAYSAAFTLSVTLFGPGSSFLTRSLNVPSFAEVNFTSHFGPGLMFLPTSFLSTSWINRWTSVWFCPLVVVTGRPRMRAGRQPGPSP